MNILARTLLSAALLCLLHCAVPAGSVAGVHYTVTDLGALRNDVFTSCFGYALNNKGQVVGRSYNGFSNHAFMYDGTMHDLGTLGGSESQALAINDDGLIVGESGIAGAGYYRHAFKYDGTMHDLTTGTGNSYSIAGAINSAGAAVGRVRAWPAYDRAVLFDSDWNIIVGTLGTDAEAWGINDSGLIVGGSNLVMTNVQHAFLYDGKMHDLGTLPGGSQSLALSVNGSGKVVGRSDTSGNNTHGFFYDGTMHDLGTLAGGQSSVGYDINDIGQIVGNSSSSDSYLHACLFEGGTVTDLNTLIDPTLDFRLEEATSINNSGQILCNGITTRWLTYRSYLLTPVVPEPSSLLALLSGLSCAGVMALRRKQ